MYSSSSNSSSQQSPKPNNPLCPTTQHLSRYASAPSSLISTAVDTFFHHQQQHHGGGFHGSTPAEPPKTTLTFLRSDTSNLTRHSSSPETSLNHLTSDLGFSVSKGHHGIESYNNGQGSSLGGHKLSRLGTQMSFTKQDHHSFSQISEANEIGSSSSQPRSTSGGFSLTSWDDSNNNYLYSSSSRKVAKGIDDDILNAIDSQELEMATMDRLFNIPQDSVPCKIRAKRGFATHPRSIAERERRTRISGKLKKLQDLVPNMDKQTSYADMLDLAVEHIKRLQDQIQKLNKDLDKCTCGCKQNMHH